MGTFSEFIAPARERHQSGVAAVNSGDYSGILQMLLAYPELAAGAVAGGVGELSGYLGQDQTQQRKLSRDIMGMMESTAGSGMSLRMVPQAPPRRSFSTSVLDRPRAVVRPDDVFRGHGEMNISIPDIPTKPYAIRRTGIAQLEDMIQSGLVRPKPGGYGRQQKATIYFGEADTPDPSFAAPMASESHIRLVAKSKDLAGHKGPIPIDRLQHIYAFRDGKEVDIFDEVLRNNNASISRAMNEGR